MSDKDQAENCEQTKPVGVERALCPTEPVACGVVGLFIGKDGRVLANVSDFNSSGYGGFTLQQAQEMRVKDSLAHEVLEKLSSPLICAAVDTYDAKKIMDSMCSRCGCRVEIVSVGHGA